MGRKMTFQMKSAGKVLFLIILALAALLAFSVHSNSLPIPSMLGGFTEERQLTADEEV
jgi:hypothetical protein